jgi:tetratricopeptide (TPR) repeat protein
MNGGRVPGSRMIVRLLVVLLVLCALPAAADAQAQRRGTPQDATEPLHEALQLLQTIRVSNLDPAWRANALARTARVLARVGDAAAARTMSKSALAAVDEPSKTAPPAVLSPGVIYALLVQTHAELGDREDAQKIATRGFELLQKLPDNATKANFLPYMAMGLADIGNRDGAGLAALEGLRAATQVPPGRDQIAALSQITMAQAKIGDRTEAEETLRIARQAAAAITDVTGRVYALAHLARAEAALGSRDRARTMARDAAMAYDRTQSDAAFTTGPRVAALGLIALAQAESLDRNAARQTLRALKATAAQLTQTYERFQALVTEVETIVLIERGV